MSRWPIGIFTSVGAGLGLPLETTAELGISTIHLHAPDRDARSSEYAGQLANQLAQHAIEVTCLFAGFAGESYADIPTVERTVGLVNPETRDARVSELNSISDFGKLMDVPAVGLHLGFVPHDTHASSYSEVVHVTAEIADYCGENGQNLHLETGQETAEALLDFLRHVNRDNLFVNFDPANMILYGTGDPIEALKKVGHLVKSIHCKDATWAAEDVRGTEWGAEVPLGDGDVGMETYLRTLKELGYEGPLTIEREIAHDRERQKADIGAAVTLLTELREKIG